MSRYRLVPSAEQGTVLREHCAHARFVWNLAVEQQSWYGGAGRGTAPGQTCSRCKAIDREARESQAVVRCRACGYCGNADTNAAMNIAAGHAVTARGRSPLGGRLNREPQLALLAS